MARSFPWWIPALLVLLVPLLITAGGGGPDHGGHSGPLLQGLGSLDSLLASAGSAPVLLNFWATWCGPCVHELPILDSLYLAARDGALFVAVSIGDPSLSTVESFREAVTIAMPVVWLSASQADSVRERYGVPPVLPVTLVLVNGEEKARIVGAATGARFSEALQGAHASTDPAGAPTDTHVYVVGPSGDPLTAALFEAAVQAAGAGGVDLVHPETPGGQRVMEENYLPALSRPYAQACVGGACHPPVYSPEELLELLTLR